MAAVLRVIDERFSATPTRVQALELRLVSERVKPRDIIRQRVEAEVAALQVDRQPHLTGQVSRSLLIEPPADSPEMALNPRRVRARMPSIDIEAEVTRALKAFRDRRYLMLLDDRQVDDLDEEVTLGPVSEAVFLYITPLRGG